MGVANNHTCCCQLYRLVPVLFLYLFSNFVQLVPIPIQLCTFLNFLKNFYYVSLRIHLSLSGSNSLLWCMVKIQLCL